MSKIVVIGANHAGTACINTMLDNLGNENEVVVFDQNSNISFLGCGMALWIGKQIDGPEGLFYSDKEKLEAKGAKVYMESPVLSVDYDKKEVTALVNGQEHLESYDKLIFATGSQPIIPPIKGVEIVEGNREFKATLENVQFVKLYQNSAEVIEKLKNNKGINRVAVVGAGYIGVELAEAFERLGKEVILIDIADTCLAGYYDRELSDLMSKNLADHGIKLAYGQTVQAVEGEGKVERIVTDKETFDVDMVIMAVGFRPNTALGAGKIELFRNGAFLVDKKQETSIPGVYAVGDCATIYDNSLGKMSYIALASNAVRSGIVGAYNATGHELEGIGVQGSNGINIYDLKMVSTGLTLEKAKSAGYNAVETGFNDLQKPEFIKHDNHEVAIRIVFDKDTRVILGAQMASHEDISMGIHLFSLAIQEKVTIDKLALTDIFFLPHFNKPYNYITMAALTAEK
ncbi:FAD-dependent oxidoreductase [Streptococcus sp. IsoGale021]|uniref:H2O-forming NADH oxidase n=1 Tax=Streptococcus TaxID=1301 RepID=UPI0020013956|nr:MULTISPECIES: FAD-dependent oxidoreductase [Streptococcus]MCY7209554.1 FAD-dependent oxidoreductase [Streptococcus anginosus]MCY7212003.1 FAD-dependent oxidoreductase [Streptococcus anginosus]MCY7226021.1 FAD-dependent oxidoreductase [Streptococcus anginosus]MDQ8694151.1 FAD-dependent oxidoreductase [Streptococcus sp. IsoGale021]MDU5127906.1 FAD-dependent oxidoreductase [Streptococcus anginosus]